MNTQQQTPDVFVTVDIHPGCAPFLFVIPSGYIHEEVMRAVRDLQEMLEKEQVHSMPAPAEPTDDAWQDSGQPVGDADNLPAGSFRVKEAFTVEDEPPTVPFRTKDAFTVDDSMAFFRNLEAWADEPEAVAFFGTYDDGAPSNDGDGDVPF